MITFLQQSKTNKNSFFVLKNKKTASHFRVDGSAEMPISELIENVPVRNVDEKPLEIPVLMKTNDKITSDGDVLEMPELNFDDKETESKQESEENAPLKIPSL